MASKKELKPLQAYKERLIQQNDGFRRDLAFEADNLHAVADWVDRGLSLYQTVGKIRRSVSPFFGFLLRKKRGSLAGLWAGCQTGFNLWRTFKRR